MPDLEPDQRGVLLWSARAETVLRVVGPIVVAAAAIVMLGRSWAKWPDVLVDFGQQLYLPWRLAEGQRLYADLAYFHGPLAQYLNALWFRLLGTGLWTLVITNLIVLTVLFMLLYRLLLRVSSAVGAMVAGVVFAAMFAFAQFVGIGNYNFVTPYEHSATYGMLTSVATLWFLARCLDRGRMTELSATGLCLGLTFLTKAEVFLAVGAAVAAALASALWARPADRGRTTRTIAVLAGTSLIPVIAAWALLRLTMPARQALMGVLGPWPSVLDGDVARLPFFRMGMGTLAIGPSLLELAVWVAWYLVLLGPALFFAWRARTKGPQTRLITAGVFVAVATVLVLFGDGIPWDRIVLPLPVAMAAAAAAPLVTIARTRHTGAGTRELVQLSMVVFAFVLLLKMILNARVSHYGFFLAMPATLMLVVAAVDWIPRWICRRRGRGEIFGAVTLAVLFATVAGHVRLMSVYLEGKTYPVAGGGDAFLADVRGAAVTEALTMIARYVGPEQTMAVLPEGVMLNYLARRVNPTPHNNLMPPALIVFGEDDILGTFTDDPPDFIMLVHKDTTEFGARFFGRDYGRRIFEWIHAEYEAVLVIGSPPLQDDRFGMMLLRRRLNNSAPAATTIDAPGPGTIALMLIRNDSIAPASLT